MNLNILIPSSIASNEVQINYRTCPTPTNLMGKPREEIEKWRSMMIKSKRSESEEECESENQSVKRVKYREDM
jgi:hypothetical protein